MAIRTINATMQMRRGNEPDFDPDKMTAGEWAVSTDSKKVWMCFKPGLVLRMATYEAFEQDMLEIQAILATCQDIQVAVEAFEKLAEQHKNDASASASAANTSETNAKNSEITATNKASEASASAANAMASESAAKLSEENASASETAAAASAASASNSASVASTKATEAASSASTAQSAMEMADSAKTAAQAAANTAQNASEDAEGYSDLSKSWAIGNTGIREGEDSNNSKYYSELAQRVVESATSGGLIPIGTLSFENLPTSGVKSGYMYNISNDFTSDSRFEDGGDIYYKAGANVYYTANGKWDVLSGVQVTGVKGDAENTYRTGNVNLTPTDIGAVKKSGDEMSGDLIMKNVTLTDGVHSRVVMTIFDDEDGAANNGSEIAIGACGNSFFGSGESYTSLRNALRSGVDTGELYTKTGEHMYISSDNNLFLYANCQTIANRKGIVLDGYGNLRPLVSGKMSLGSQEVHWGTAYIDNIIGKMSNPLKFSGLIDDSYDGSVSKDVFIPRIYHSLTDIDESYTWENFSYSLLPDGSMLQYHLDLTDAAAAYESKLIPVNSSGYITVISSSDGFKYATYITVTSVMFIANNPGPINFPSNWRRVALSTYGSMDGLTADRALISSLGGDIEVSTVTSTELGYLSGVTSNVQTQLNNRLPLSGGTMTGNINFPYNKGVYWNNAGRVYSSSNQHLFFGASDEGKYFTQLGVVDNMWAYAPDVNGMLQLGTPNKRWGALYANNGTIQTSDRNSKKNIAQLTDKHLQFFMILQPVSYMFIDGASGRTHIGFISQDVEEAMKQVGLTDLDFAGFCKDKKIHSWTEIIMEEEEQVNEETGKTEMVTVERAVYHEEPVLNENGGQEYIYSLRYEEFIALNTYAIQQLSQRLDTICKKLSLDI